MNQLLVVTFSSIMLVSAARAEPATSDAPPAAPAPGEKMICVRSQADTGSHFGASKVCHTESEWTMIRNHSSRMLEQYDTLQNKQITPASGR